MSPPTCKSRAAVSRKNLTILLFRFSAKKCQPDVYRTVLRNFYNVSVTIAVGQGGMGENFVWWEGYDTCISLIQQYVYIYIFMYVFI